MMQYEKKNDDNNFYNTTNFRSHNDYLFFPVKSLVGGRTYYFRVVAYSLKSFQNSEEIKFPVPARVKHKAITAGVVGGLLFFIVAIILSVCAVKICNKRKRRKHEKGTCARTVLTSLTTRRE